MLLKTQSHHWESAVHFNEDQEQFTTMVRAKLVDAYKFPATTLQLSFLRGRLIVLSLVEASHCKQSYSLASNFISSCRNQYVFF